MSGIDLATPQAQRLRRPSWRDPRLLVGLLLVLLSTALGGWVVSRADRTVPVYAAQRALVPGEAVSAQDVRRVDVLLGEADERYLSAAVDLPPDLHVLRAVGDGELIPLAATGTRDQVRTQVVALQVDTTSASMLEVGSIVDVFVNRPTGGASVGGRPAYGGPEQVLEGATVAALPDASSVLGGVVSQRPVQLVVPVDKVQALIADIDLGSRITLVAAPGAPRQGS